MAPRSLTTATDSSARVVVLTAEDLEHTGERSLPRAIAKAAGPGVWLQETNLGGGSPILRGVIGEKILIVIDGVRLNDGATRLGPNQSLNTIDPAIVERVEVVRGPASLLYGSDAVGGAILIWTKQRAPNTANRDGVVNGLGATLESTYESASTGIRGALGVSGSTVRDGWLVIGSAADWNELESGDGEQDFTGYDTRALFFSYVRELDEDRSLRFSGRLHRDYNVPRTDRLVAGYGQTQPANVVFNFQRQESSGLTLAYTDDEPGAMADSMQARTFLRYAEECRQIQATGSSTLREERDVIVGWGAGVDWRKELSESHTLTYGLDFDRDDVTESERTNVNVNTGVETAGVPTFAPNSHYASAGAFVQDEIAAFDPYDVTVGVRYSYFDFSFNEFTSRAAGGPEHEGDFDAFTGSLGVARDLSESWRVTGTLAQSFRAPHLDDVAKNGTIFGGTELANDDLDPEESLTAEIDVDYDDGPWTGSLAMYYTDISDYIGRVLVDEGDPMQTGDETYQRENTGRVAIWGAELSLQRRLEGVASDFALEAGVVYTKGRQYDDTVNQATGEATYDGVPARRIPPLNGILALLYAPLTPEHWITWGRLELVAADEQDELNPEDLSDPRIDPDGTAGWATLSIDVGGPIGEPSAGSTWIFGVHNIFDKQYRVHGSGIDAPGINVVVGMSWSF